MKKKLIKALKRTFWSVYSILSKNSIQKRLGYSRTAKLLIIHADDIGFSASENIATFNAIKGGLVNSGSIMVPCHGFEEAASWLKEHPEVDAGVHLTLTGEWDAYRIKPLLDRSEIPSVADSEGFFFKSKNEFASKATPPEMEKECREQIKRALDSGVDITHIDSHMYSTFANDGLLKKYISLGREFNVPVLLTREMPLWVNMLKKAIIVDRLYCADMKDFENGLDKYYTEVLKSLRPGLNCLLVHVAYNDQSMMAITKGEKAFGAEWRQGDFDFFTSQKCRDLITGNNVKLITWREIRDKLLRQN